MGSAVRNFKKLFEDRTIETFWFSAFLFGVIWFFLTLFIFDYQKTPPFLTHINGTIGTFIAAAFLVRNEKTDRLIYFLFFPVLANCLATAVGRLYLDFDSHGSWIVFFHNARSKYNCAELYRIIDFFSHFLIPIAFMHLALNNKERIQRIFRDSSMSSSTLPLIIHWLFPLTVLLCWYTSVALAGYNPVDLYLIKTAGLSDAVIIFLLTPLFLTMPIHYGLMQEHRADCGARYINGLIFSAALAISVLSFKIYKFKMLFMNTMFMVSILIIVTFLLKYLKIIKKEFHHLVTAFLVLASFFFFLVEELHFWSVGGSEAVFLSTLKTHNFVQMHYIIKELFYVFMVFYLYASHVCCYTYRSDVLFLKAFVSRNFKLLLSFGCILFGAAYFIGIFKEFDIEHTTLDPLWFFFGMLFALEIAFPTRYLLQSLKQK